MKGYCRNCGKIRKRWSDPRRQHDRDLCSVCHDPLTLLSVEELKLIDKINKEFNQDEHPK